MNNKWKYIITGFFSALLAVFIYTTLRVDRLELEYIQGLKHSTRDIVNFYSGEFKKAGPGTGNTLDVTGIAKTISSNYPNIALLLVSDRSKSIKITSKNDRYIKTTRMYDDILADFTGGKFNMARKPGYLVRYYDVKTEDRLDQYKFYIFIRDVKKDRLCIVYPYNPGNVMVARMGLEISLILILITVITTLLYILSLKRGMTAPPAEAAGEAETTEIDPSRRTMERENRQYLKSSGNISAETLQEAVYDLFNSIHNAHSPELISMYIRAGGETLIKKFEMKGSSFITFDADTFDNIELNNQTGRELQQGSVLVLEKSRKIILPLRHDSSLTGVILILRQDGFSGTDVENIKKSAESLTSSINDFLILNSVMTDSGTGLYSKTSFTMKYNEALQMKENDGRDFTLVFLDISGNPAPENPGERATVIRLITPAIEDICKKDDHVCLYDESVAILMTGTANDQAVEKAERILESLSKIRIKINKERTIQVIPHMGLAASDSVTDTADLLSSARKNMELARENSHASLKASRINI